MDDLFSFRGSIFSKLHEINLANSTNDIYEAEVFSYLNSIQSSDDFTKLQKFSNKLTKLNDLEWLNVKESLNFHGDLTGKLVLIDFWTYCCVNCMHIIPMLNQLENEFSQLCVIGIHSSKFTNEKSKANIFHAIRRHLIKHPVVCDSDLLVWNDMQIFCWPTLLVLDPEGVVIAEFIGETQANYVKPFLSSCFKFYSNKLQDNVKLAKFFTSFNADSTSTTGNSFNFPTKMCLDSKESLLFVSDSGNNKILAIDYKSNEIKYTIGSGRSGLSNGSFENSEFDWPQGLALDIDLKKLYIADTFNDLIRCADLNSKSLSTLCGIPLKSSTQIGNYDLVGGKKGKLQAISTPWDLCIINKENSKVLLICCAGTHQVWLYSFENESLRQNFDLKELNWWRGLKFNWDTLICVAGNGKERNKNNSYPLQASFAQPSGIDYDQHNNFVYLADAESSTVRTINLKDGSVKNIVGGDQLQPDDLFAYGDRDGKGSEARLQHVLDVRYLKQSDNEFLLVADTYNHALKLIDLKTKFCKKLQLNMNLNEPNGLCIDPTTKNVYISDTNNHSIKIIENFDANKTEFQVNELILANQNITELIENIQLKNEILVDFDFELNLEASNNNNWHITLIYENQTKSEFKGVFEKANKKNELYKLTSVSSEVESIKKIELDLCVCYCEQNNLLGKICKILKRKFSYASENMLKKIGFIVLKVQNK